MIVFVDDEPFFIDSYLEALRDAGYEVSFFKRVDEAMKAFENQKDNIDLIISDVMMPSTPHLEQEEDALERELKTGMFFYDWIRQRSMDVPVIILTNKGPGDVDDKLRSERNVWLFRKSDLRAPKLVEHVRELLEERAS